MNLNMNQWKNETENLFLSVNINYETRMNKTHTKSQETLEFKPNQPRATFSIKPPKLIERSWMIGLTSLEVYESIFNTTEEKIKFEFHADNSDEFSFTEIKVELEELLGLSGIKPAHLQHDIIRPSNIKA